MDGLFDERMALSGGSDSHFLQRVHRAGFKIVWSDEAVATEWVPPSRVRARWIFQRAYRFGTTIAFTYRDLNSTAVATAALLGMGCYRVGEGMCLFPVGLVRGRHGIVGSVRRICYGTGMLAGLAGVNYEEYRGTHGT